MLQLTKPIRDRAARYDYPLDKNLVELLHKERFLELLHDFMVYARGQKKLARPNQYFGVKAAQDFVKRKEGGIIWHTQGSGKSLTMVWLTKWLREYNPNARVLIITDREELDEQIEKVYNGVSENIYRTKSGKDLLEKLNDNAPWLMCSLIHKFGGKEEVDEKDMDAYLQGLKSSIPSDFKAKGDMVVFVDECHRTQTGKLHEAMKQFIPDALFVGFTGTPLLKSDKQTSLEVFGRYIHIYKFDEAVNDMVVLDLRYEARGIEQKITSSEKIDEWFELKTRGLTDFAKAELKQKWGTLKKVFSSKSRLEKIVLDMMLDMEKKERLQKGKERLNEALEAIKALCEAVDPPKDTLAHIRYFCGKNTENPDELKDTEPKRVSLYKLTIALIRAYANIADEMKEAGYTDKETEQIKKDVKHFENLRKEIQLASGDYIDLKQYEPAMRYLIDSYIGAEESRMLANFDDMSLVELLVERGKDAINDLPKNIRRNKDAMAEAIENNLRKVIIEESPTNPMYYEKMSVLLDELIKLRKADTQKYEKYLQEIIALSKKVKKPGTTSEYPFSINTNAKRALYDNLGNNEAIANELDQKIVTTKKDGWRDNIQKTKAVKYVIEESLNKFKVKEPDAEYILNLVKNQRDY